MIEGKTIGALIPAAGVGRRLGGPVAKQFLSLAGVPILVRTVGLFASWAAIDEIVVAVAAGEEEPVRELLAPVAAAKLRAVVRGGKERQQSVEAALAVSGSDIVLVHDAVRPFASRHLLDSVAVSAIAAGAAVAARPARLLPDVDSADHHLGGVDEAVVVAVPGAEELHVPSGYPAKFPGEK